MLERAGPNLKFVGFEINIFVEGHTVHHASVRFDAKKDAETFVARIMNAKTLHEKKVLLGMSEKLVLVDKGNQSWKYVRKQKLITISFESFKEYTPEGDIFELVWIE